jgi:hypothetical protein
MQPIQRFGTLISGFLPVVLVLLLGVGGCTPTEKAASPKSPRQTESPDRTAGPEKTPSDAAPAAKKTPEKPPEKPVENPTEKPLEKPQEKTSEKPTVLPAEQSPEKPQEKPLEKSPEKPQEEPAVKKSTTPKKPSPEPTPPPSNESPVTPSAEMSKVSAAKEPHQLQKDKEVEEEKEATEENEKKEEALRREELKKYIASLGEPQVEHPEELKRADPLYPLWIAPKRHQVVMLGEICQTEAPLEMFACTRGTKEHEAILSVPLKAFMAHAALLGVGAEAGHPVQFGPKEGQYIPAAGTEIKITIRWKDNQGKVQTARAQDWIKNMRTGKPLKTNWVFGGSGFWKDGATGKEYYKAEGGDFICVSNFASAMLDLPIPSSYANADLLFQANPKRVPPQGTAVTVILSPKLTKKTEKTDQPADGKKKDEKKDEKPEMKNK